MVIVVYIGRSYVCVLVLLSSFKFSLKQDRKHKSRHNKGKNCTLLGTGQNSPCWTSSLRVAFWLAECALHGTPSCSGRGNQTRSQVPTWVHRITVLGLRTVYMMSLLKAGGQSPGRALWGGSLGDPPRGPCSQTSTSSDLWVVRAICLDLHVRIQGESIYPVLRALHCRDREG